MRFKFIIFLGLGVLAFYGTMKFCLEKTGKFIVTDMMSDRPFDPSFETKPLSGDEESQVAQALNQKYIYFGCGGQAFVFFSEDGNFVLKFFKQRHFRLPTHLNYIPFIEKYRSRKFATRYKRIHRDYDSYKIGFEELGELTGLVYLHLNKTDHLKKKLSVIDKLNIEHQIDLDKTDFILQRRAGLVLHTIHHLMGHGHTEEAKKTISEVVGLIVTRCKKGLRDKDPNIASNCGILNGRAIKIDVGRFTRDPNMAKPLYYKPELYYLTRPLRTWLKQEYPDLVETLDAEVLKVIIE